MDVGYAADKFSRPGIPNESRTLKVVNHTKSTEYSIMEGIAVGDQVTKLSCFFYKN